MTSAVFVCSPALKADCSECQKPLQGNEYIPRTALPDYHPAFNAMPEMLISFVKAEYDDDNQFLSQSVVCKECAEPFFDVSFAAFKNQPQAEPVAPDIKGFLHTLVEGAMIRLGIGFGQPCSPEQASDLKLIMDGVITRNVRYELMPVLRGNSLQIQMLQTLTMEGELAYSMWLAAKASEPQPKAAQVDLTPKKEKSRSTAQMFVVPGVGRTQ